MTDSPGRRIVRITVDVLLPLTFHAADPADIHVTGVAVTGHDDTRLSDVIDYRVVEARVVLTDAPAPSPAGDQR